MKTNGALKIEKGVPLPSKARKSEVADLMRAMKKGDSILIHGRKGDSVRTSASTYIGIGKYAVRAEGDGFRVWRTD